MPLKCPNDMCQNYNFQEKTCRLFSEYNVPWEDYLTRCERCRGLVKMAVTSDTGAHAEVYKRGK